VRGTQTTKGKTMNPWILGGAILLAALIYTCHWCPTCTSGANYTYGEGYIIHNPIVVFTPNDPEE